MFEYLARLVEAEGMDVGKVFIAKVNTHIIALEAWDRHVASTIERERELFDAPPPARAHCDSDLAYQSALRFWSEAQRGGGYLTMPAPTAPREIEAAIDAIWMNGAWSYTYSETYGGPSTVAESAFLQSAKYEG